MENFAIGFWSWALAAVLVVGYLLAYAMKRVGAWSQKKKPPGDRVWFFAMVAAISGFLVGSFVQPTWGHLAECRGAGYPLFDCLMSRSR